MRRPGPSRFARGTIVEVATLPPMRRSAKLAIVILGGLLAVLAFGNAAAGVGLRLPIGSMLGAGFAPIKVDLAIMSQRQSQPGFRGHVSAERTAREALLLGPVNARALRMLGLSLAAQGDMVGARRVMAMGERLSRRDAVTQAWLSDDAIRQNKINDALPRLDRILRTKPGADDVLLTRLVALLPVPEAREALLPFVNADNPWLDRYLRIAVTKSPKAAPVGELLASAGVLPSNEFFKESYATLVLRLSDEGDYDVLRRLYPKLPGATRQQLSSVQLPTLEAQGGYAPVVWEFGERSDRGGAVLDRNTAEFFAMGDVRGVAARKLVFLDGRVSELRFGTLERDGVDDSSAFWRVTCVVGPSKSQVATSANLLKLPTPATYSLRLPVQCGAAMIEMIVDGGTGRDATRTVVSNVRIAKVSL